MACIVRWFLVMVVCNVQNCFGQDTLTKYFIIDTILFHKDVIKNRLYDRQYFMDLLVKENGSEIKIEDNFYEESNPNLVSKVRYLQGDSLAIGIIIDDKKSLVWLNHLEHLPDTIRIPKWNLVHNALQDSVKTWVGYYHWIGDSVAGLYKQKSKEYVTNKKSKNHLSNYSFILNNISYEVPLTIEDENLVTWYHGYASRKGEAKGLKKANRGRKIVKYNRFACSVHKKQKIYAGKISL